jgi:hypothetical protein
MTLSDLVGLLYRAHWTDFGVSGTAVVTDTSITRRTPLGTQFDPSLRPAWLLSGYRLQMGDRVQFGDRDGWRVTAVPRSLGQERHPLDRVETVVDAGLGILLRYAEIWDGQPLEIRELEGIRVADPEGRPREDDPGEGFPDVTRLGGLVTAADVAAEGLSVLIRNSRKEADGVRSTMPAAPPRAEGADVSREQLFTLSGSGEGNFAAVVHEWVNAEALSGPMRTAATKAEMGGVNALAEAIDRKMGTRYTVTKLRYGGPLRYRVDYLEGAKPESPATIACDGTELWRSFPGKVVVWPAEVLEEGLPDLVDTSWLLEQRLEDVSEIEWYGRPAFRVRASRDRWPTRTNRSRRVSADADVIVDQELGIALRIIYFRDDRPVMWTELRDVESPADLDLEMPAGVRVVHERGDSLDKTQLPDPVKAALRTTGDAVSAARRLFGRPS